MAWARDSDRTPPEPLLPRPARLIAKRRETADTVSLELRAADGGALHFQPGQFNMLCVPGVGEVPISVSGAGRGEGTLVHTVRRVGPVTAALAAMRPPDAVGLRGPFGNAWPLGRLAGRDVVVMAGGIGLAPLRPAVERLLARRADYGRVSVLYGARSPSELLYRRDLERWRGRLGAEVAVTVDRSEKGWRGPVGVVTTLLAAVRWERGKAAAKPFSAAAVPGAANAPGAAALVCGPEVMLRFCAAELEKRGLAPSDIFLSLERDMKCGVGLCGHCQLGPFITCRDGPIVSWERAAGWLGVREL